MPAIDGSSRWSRITRREGFRPFMQEVIMRRPHMPEYHVNWAPFLAAAAAVTLALMVMWFFYQP